MRTAEQCAKALAKRLHKQGMTQEEAMRIAKELWEKKVQNAEEGKNSAKDLFASMSEHYGDERMANAKARFNTANNIRIYRDVKSTWERIRTTDEQFITGNKSFKDFMEGYLAGSEVRFEGGFDSIDIAGYHYGEYNNAKLFTALEQVSMQYGYEPAFLRKMLTEKAYEAEQATFITELVNAPGTTGNKMYADAANAIRPIIENLRVRDNRAGGDTAKLHEGYAGPQTHDPDKLTSTKNGASEGWKAFINDLLDWDATMGKETPPGRVRGKRGTEPRPALKPEERGRVLDDIFNTIRTGRDADLHGSETAMPVTVGRSKHRVLIFKDGASWVKYHNKYGEGNLIEGIAAHIKQASQRVIMRERLGNKPEEMLGKIIEGEKYRLGQEMRTPEAVAKQKALESVKQDLYTAKKENRDTTGLKEAVKEAKKNYAPVQKAIDDLATLDSAYNTKIRARPAGVLARQMQELMGETRQATNPSVAKVMADIRNVKSMGSLGLAALSSASDIALASTVQRQFGVDLMSRIVDPITAYLKRYPAGSFRQQVARDAGFLVTASLGHVTSKLDLNQMASGMTNKLVNRFHWVSGTTFGAEQQKAGMALSMSMHIGNARNNAWKDLMPEIREGLTHHGFNEKSWGLLRHMTDEYEGNHFLSARNAVRLSEEQLKPLMRESLQGDKPPKGMSKDNFQKAKELELYNLRNQIETKVLSFFGSTARGAISEPGAKTRATLLRGTRPGDAAGEALRFMTMFKSFPVTVYQRHIKGQSWRKYGHQGFDAPGFASLMGMMFITGLASITLKDLAKGRTPRDMNLETVIEAMLQGGVFGLVGDFAAGKPTTGKVADMVLGPFGRPINDVSNVMANLLRGEGAEAGDTAIKLLAGNVPGANLPYTVGAMNYFFLDNLKEMLNPGYKHRMMNAWHKQGQTSLFYED